MKNTNKQRSYGVKTKVVIGRYFDEYTPKSHLADGSIPTGVDGKVLEVFLDENYQTPVDKGRASKGFPEIPRPKLEASASLEESKGTSLEVSTGTGKTVPEDAKLAESSTVPALAGDAALEAARAAEEARRNDASDEQQAGARTSPNQSMISSSQSELHPGFGTMVGWIVVFVRLQKMYLENNGLWIKLGFLSKESLELRHEEESKPVTMLPLNNQDSAGKLNVVSEVQVTIVPRINSETLPPFNHSRNIILQYPSYKSLTEVAEILLDHEFIFGNENRDFRYVVDHTSIKAVNTRKTTARYF